MVETRVAAFLSCPKEVDREGELARSPEAGLVAALMFLHRQSQYVGPLRFSFLARLYMPLYLVHAIPGRSLVVSGVGNPSISVRHATIPSMADIQSQLGSTRELRQVPELLENLVRLVEEQEPATIEIRGTLPPRMAEPLRLLITGREPPRPLESECLDSRLPTRELLDVGTLFRTELARLDWCLSRMERISSLIDEYVGEQLSAIDGKRERISVITSLVARDLPISGEEKLHLQARSGGETRPVDEATAQLMEEKKRISLEAVGLLRRLEERLDFSAEKLRRLAQRIQESPIGTERILEEVRERLTYLRTTSQEFQSALQQAFTQLESLSSQLEEAERQWLWSRSQGAVQKSAPPLTSHLLSHGEEQIGHSALDAAAADAQISELIKLRSIILAHYGELRDRLHSSIETIRKQREKFEAISIPNGELRGGEPLVRVLVPLFVVKLREGPGRYGVLPPVRLERSSTGVSVDFFDEAFCERLRELMRGEILGNPRFRLRLDQYALDANWITRIDGVDRFHRGLRLLISYQMLTEEEADEITAFWLSIVKRCPFCGQHTQPSLHYCTNCGRPIRSF